MSIVHLCSSTSPGARFWWNTLGVRPAAAPPRRAPGAGLARDLRGTCSELARSKDFELDFAIRALRLQRMLWFSTCPFRTVFAAHLLNFRACAEFSRTQSQKHARNVAPRGGADEVRKKCGRCAEEVRKKCGRRAGFWLDPAIRALRLRRLL